MYIPKVAMPLWVNVDPGGINRPLVIMGVCLGLVGIIAVGGVHPQINKQGLINPGSTLPSGETPGSSFPLQGTLQRGATLSFPRSYQGLSKHVLLVRGSASLEGNQKTPPKTGGSKFLCFPSVG